MKYCVVLQRLRDVQKLLSQEGADGETSQRRLPSRMPMLVFQRGFWQSRRLASKTTVLVNTTERTQVRPGTTMMDTRSINTLFSRCVGIVVPFASPVNREGIDGGSVRVALG